MKKLSLLLILSTGLISLLSAQKLTRAEMEDLYYKDIISKTEYLLSKEWRLDDAAKGQDSEQAAWAFHDNSSGLIIAYLSVLDPKKDNKAFVYTTFSFNIFQEFRESLSDMEMVNTGVENDNLFIVYENEKLVYRLEISSDKMISENFYSISLVQNPSYKPDPKE